LPSRSWMSAWSRRDGSMLAARSPAARSPTRSGVRGAAAVRARAGAEAALLAHSGVAVRVVEVGVVAAGRVDADREVASHAGRDAVRSAGAACGQEAGVLKPRSWSTQVLPSGSWKSAKLA
jgi:hypothetical protein